MEREMSIRHRRSTLQSPSPSPALECDDMLAEIFLLLPPQPSSLPRASAVCKQWRSLASDPGFSHRFRRHHSRNPPPLLGFFDTYHGLTFQPTLDAPNRVSPERFSLWPDDDDDDDRFITLGCHHGLVLMLAPKRKQVRVWDPITGDHHRIALPSKLDVEETLANGAVLRAAGGTHHFQVVMVVARDDEKIPRQAHACIYSSETGAWGDLISAPLPPDDGMSLLPTDVLSCMPAVLVGDSLYWNLVENYAGILEFYLKKQSLAVIKMPAGMCRGNKELTVMRADGGGLGFPFVSEFYHYALLWKRKTDCDGVGSWVLERTIKLDKILSLDSKKRYQVKIGGYAEENNVVLLSAVTGLFMVQLDSLQFQKLFTTHNFCRRHPFESVYAAGGV